MVKDYKKNEFWQALRREAVEQRKEVEEEAAHISYELVADDKEAALQLVNAMFSQVSVG